MLPEKGEDECEKLLISSKDASEGEKESTSLEAEEKGEQVRKVSHDEIMMQEKREIKRNVGTSTEQINSICSRTL